MTKPAAFFLIALGCASGVPPRISPPVTISQVSRVEPVRIAVRSLDPSVSNGIPVEYELRVTNPLDHPVTLQSVEIETVGSSGAYSLKRVRHRFSTVIEPQMTTVLPIRVWVLPLQDTDTGDVNGPVTVRGAATFVSDRGGMQTRFAARVQ